MCGLHNRVRFTRFERKHACIYLLSLNTQKVKMHFRYHSQMLCLKVRVIKKFKTQVCNHIYPLGIVVLFFYFFYFFYNLIIERGGILNLDIIARNTKKM